MKKIIKKLTLLTLVLLSLSGCYELGEFESDEQYFEYFPSVELIDKDKSSKSYSVKDYFYTEEGINEYQSDVPYKEYLYLFVKVDNGFHLNEINLSFCSQQECTLEVSIYVLDSIPSNIRGYDDPLLDDEGNEIEYDDPIDALDTKIIHLDANKWTSSYLINKSRNEYIAVEKGQYIAFKFENNSFKGKEKGLPLTTFTTTNLLIRAQGS